jgi:hypothetical protein
MAEYIQLCSGNETEELSEKDCSPRLGPEFSRSRPNFTSYIKTSGWVLQQKGHSMPCQMRQIYQNLILIYLESKSSNPHK